MSESIFPKPTSGGKWTKNRKYKNPNNRKSRKYKCVSKKTKSRKLIK